MIAPVIEMLAQQYVGRILDYHLGNYELEEGEIIDYEVTLDELRAIAERILLREEDEEEEEENPYTHICME